MNSPAAALPLSEREAHALLRLALSRSWASRSKLWCRACVELLPGRPPRVVPRVELATRLRGDDLPELAAECLARRVPPGHVLAYAVLDDESELSGAGFSVVDLGAR